MELKFRGKEDGVKATGGSDQTATRFSNLDTAGYVFVLNRKAPASTKTFLQNKLAESQLNVSPINSPDDTDKDKDLILLVTCDLHILQQFTKHVYVPQQLRRQSADKDDSLAIPEQERVLLYILETIIQKERSKLVGLEKVTIYPGQSIGTNFRLLNQQFLIIIHFV